MNEQMKDVNIQKKKIKKKGVISFIKKNRKNVNKLEKSDSENRKKVDSKMEKVSRIERALKKGNIGTKIEKDDSKKERANCKKEKISKKKTIGPKSENENGKSKKKDHIKGKVSEKEIGLVDSEKKKASRNKKKSKNKKVSKIQNFENNLDPKTEKVSKKKSLISKSSVHPSENYSGGRILCKRKKKKNFEKSELKNETMVTSRSKSKKRKAESSEDGMASKKKKFMSKKKPNRPTFSRWQKSKPNLKKEMRWEDIVIPYEESSTSIDDQNCLTLDTPGFDWSAKALNQQSPDEASSSDEEEDKVKQMKPLKRLNQYELTAKMKVDETRIRELELQRLDSDRQPETAMDFEEKIETSPHSSSVWIEYASFYLENAETEKAKEVITRAFGVIPATKEKERLALWNVLLRLEVMYGTPESVQESLKEALITNDELSIFYIMIDIYVSADKMADAESMVKLMTKKFSRDKEVWLRAGLFHFKAKELKEARHVLDRSLLSLRKEEHLDVIHRFAQYEMKLGDPERGRTIYEKILSNFPKRLDMWFVYVDLLIKEESIKEARSVLERMVGLKLKMKSMRSIFKKFIEFEKKYGTPQSVEAVKVRVEEFVSAALKETD